jgi:hypothetical protein
MSSKGRVSDQILWRGLVRLWYSKGMSFARDLEALFQEEPGRCGLLDSEVTRGETGCRVTLTCECVAAMCRQVEPAPGRA